MMTNRIVSDGRDRLLADPTTQTAIAELEMKVRQEYAQRLSEAGWFRRLFLRMEISREIRKRIECIAPGDALYFASNRDD